MIRPKHIEMTLWRGEVPVFYGGSMRQTSNMEGWWTKETFGFFLFSKPPPLFHVDFGCENR